MAVEKLDHTQERLLGAGRPVQTRDSGYAWYVAAVMCLGFCISYMDRSVLPLLVAPLERSMKLNDTGVSLLQGAAFGIFYALFGFPLARLADRANRRNLILIAVLVWSAATVACGLARTVPQLFAARICVAIGEAVLAPAAVSIIADYFSPSLRNRALSIYSMGVFFGGGLSLGLGGTLLRSLGPHGVTATPIGPLDSWRIVFIALGLGGLVLVPLLLAVREPARLAEHGGADDGPASLQEVARVFSRKRAALLAVIVGFAGLALGAQTLQAWAPTMFVRLHHWNVGSAGQRFGVFTFVLGPLGALTGAFLADALERAGRADGKLLVGLLSSVFCVGVSILATLPLEPVAFFGVVSLQFFVAFNFGLVQAALAELLPNRMRALGSACYVATTNLVTATLGPLIVGLLNDRVFHDPNMVAVSIRWVSPAAFVLAGLVLAFGLRSYRSSVTEGASWVQAS